MAPSTNSTARKNPLPLSKEKDQLQLQPQSQSPFGSSLPLLKKNPPITMNGVRADKIETIRQLLLRDPDAAESPDSASDPILEAVKELASDSSSATARCYQSALSTSFSQCTEPHKDSFATAGSIKIAAGADRGDSTSSDETSTSGSLIGGGDGGGGGMNKPHKANDCRWEAIRAVRAHEGALGLNHFRPLRKLGCGDIGSVYLSELRGTKSYFAMKVMDKAVLASRKKLSRAQTEREILQCLDHPFLPTLYTHFETEKFSCLVMEFCPGGDLHALRQRQPSKCFSEQAARFYVAEVLLALEYLHMLGIIYRDLKPENVLVREDGHIMLSDFDLSLRCAVSPTLVNSSRFTAMDISKTSGYCIQPSCIQPSSCIQPPSCMQPTCFAPPRFLMSRRTRGSGIKANLSNGKLRNNGEDSTRMIPFPELMAEPTSARSMSFVGTHEYLAPEIVKGEGHGSAVDWWTFGVFLYELLFGRTPFKGSGNRATLFNVVGEPLKFPEFPAVSFAARDLIRGLLVKEPQQRLAYRRGATEVKQHPFFQSVNWALIRCTSPPEVPKPFRKINIDPSFAGDGRGGGGVLSAATANLNNSSGDVDVKPSGKYLDIEFF